MPTLLFRRARLSLCALFLASTFTGCVADNSSTEDDPEDAEAAGGAGGMGGAGGGAGGMGGMGGMTAPDAEVPDAEIPDAADQPDAEVMDEGGAIGDACERDEDCDSGLCLANANWPGGACVTDGCPADGCPDGAVCAPGPDGAPLCVAECTAESCREGYRCVDAAGQPACVPGEDVGRVDGLPCGEDGQCAGGNCIDEWPGGFCTTSPCQSREDCARGEGAETDNRCFVANNPPFCVRMCQAPGDCRQGFVCQPVGQGQGVCFPNNNEPLFTPEEIEDSPLNIQCADPGRQNRFDLDFTVSEDTTAYMVVPFSIDGQGIDPRAIIRPSGELINFRGENAFQRATAQLFGNINPTTVPATRDFEGQLESGDHRYVVSSGAEQVCWYTLEEPAPGTVIDMNVYLVGLGIAEATAAQNEDLQATLGQFNAVFAAAGIEVGELRYFELRGEAADRYTIIRNQGDVGGVLTETAPPGPDLDDALSINVVFNRGFALPGGDGILGISQGLPGPAGLHGTAASGVVFTGEFLGEQFRQRNGEVVDGNIFTGNVLAHEVGHYLGLFHTTEQNNRSTDPLQDTPDCRGSNFPNGCPDRNNLMFPLAGFDNSIVTEDQASVIRANPLTKE